MQWIWTDGNSDIINTYAEFKQRFFHSKGEVTLNISVSDEYAVFINGEFAECGQYDDYTHYKIYDSVNLTTHCKKGTNELLIRVYYQGVSSAQCTKSSPKLWYLLASDKETYESGKSTLSRKFSAYADGNMEYISPQQAFTFHYDARKCETHKWVPAYCLDCNITPIPRPIKKLTVFPPAKAKILNQGVLISHKPSVLQTPAERIYSDLIAPRYAEEFISYTPVPQKAETYTYTEFTLPCSGYTFSAPDGFDGVYMIIDLGRELSGFPHLELEAEEGTVFDIGYGEHLDDGRVRTSVGMRNFAFSYTARNGRQSFTHYFKRCSGRYLELHVRTRNPFTLYHLTLQHTEYPLNAALYPKKLTDSLARKIYDVSVDTLKLCMHEHYEDCPWREQALYSMDARNQALAGFYAFQEYDYPYACWKLFEPSLREDGMFPITVPSDNKKTIPSFTLAWVIACEELVSYGGEKYNTFTDTMRKILDAFSKRAENGILSSLEGKEYWNYFEWADNLAGHNGESDTPQQSAALTLFFYAALRSYSRVCSDDRYKDVMSGIRKNFHNTFWNSSKKAYHTHAGEEHFAELVQSLSLWCGLVPDEYSKDLRKQLANRNNDWTKVTLSHYIYKLDALMMEPEIYYSAVNDDIMKVWSSMIYSGATTFWETIDGGDAFTKAGSLCHGWSAIPIYFWSKYEQFSE